MRPWLYAAQRDAIFCPERYAVIEASTKAGKTVGCIVWLAEQALAGQAGRNYWWVAPIYPQAKIAFRRLKRGLTSRDVYRANESDLTLTLANEAVLWFKGADKPDSLYGEDVYAAVADEASRWKEESWHALRTTLTATRAPVRIIGNVKGRKNWAYQLARRAEAGEPDMRYSKITAYDAVAAGVLSADEIADARRTLPASVFRELYEAEPSDDEGNPFGLEAIRACATGLSAQPPVVWGWDLAKSVDYTAGVGLDVRGDVCRLERFQAPWELTMQRIAAAVGPLPALVDSTGVGDPVLEGLQQQSQSARQAGQYAGFKFTAPSKQQLMEGLAVDIQHRAVHFPPEGALRAELEQFEYQYTRSGVHYGAPEGSHDDTVCALALARHLWRERYGYARDATPAVGPARW